MAHRRPTASVLRRRQLLQGKRSSYQTTNLRHQRSRSRSASPDREAEDKNAFYIVPVLIRAKLSFAPATSDSRATPSWRAGH